MISLEKEERYLSEYAIFSELCHTKKKEYKKTKKN